MLNIITTYVIVISKLDEIPAKIYLAKHLSLISLSKSQTNFGLWHFHPELICLLSNEQCIRAILPFSTAENFYIIWIVLAVFSNGRLKTM